jgi:hypothetical protein
MGLKLLTDQNDNVYVFATGKGFGNNDDFWLIKYDPNGNKIFQLRYGDPAYGESFGDALFDNSGNIIVAVSTRTVSDSTYNMALLKYNSSGIIQQYQSYSSTYSHITPLKLLKDFSGNIFVAGSNYNYIDNGVFVQKYSSQFQLLAQTFFFGVPSALNAFCDAELMLNTDIIICASFKQLSGEYNLSVYKLNNYFSSIWSRTYSIVSGSNETVNDMIIDNNSNIYLTGNTSTGHEAITVKLNIDGYLLWSKLYDRGGQHNYSWDVQVDAYGNVYCSGLSALTNQSVDAMILKYNSNGVLQFDYNYNGLASQMDYFTGMNVSPTGIITASGVTTNYVNGVLNYDMLTINMQGNFTGLSNTNENIPGKFSLEQNYPNPFNPSTTIRFSLPADSKVKLVVFNSAGQEVASLLNEEMNAGTYEYQFDAGKLSSGVYFYKLITDNFTDTKKMMLVK